MLVYIRVIKCIIFLTDAIKKKNTPYIVGNCTKIK